jgi:hypothetical protein
MRFNFFPVAIFAGFLFAAGCASKDFREPGVLSTASESTRRSYSGSYGDVWRATLNALTSKKYALASSQREGGVIVTDWILGKSDRLYSGYGDNRIPYSIRFKFSIKLQPSRSGVNVSVKNEEQYMADAVTAGTDFSGSLYQWIPTDSSTVKEATFLEEIGTQLASLKNAGAK